jgi:hypothetical protein
MPALYKPNRIASLITGQAVPALSGVAVMASLVGNNHNLVTQASLSTITVTIWDIQPWVDSQDDAVAVLTSTTVTISSTVFDSLQQQDGLWTKDSAGNLGGDVRWGYNFKHTLGASNFTAARSDHRHRAQYVFTPTSGEIFRLLVEFDTIKLFA